MKTLRAKIAGGNCLTPILELVNRCRPFLMHAFLSNGLGKALHIVNPFVPSFTSSWARLKRDATPLEILCQVDKNRSKKLGAQID